MEPSPGHQDFIAELIYKSTKDGGRISPASTGIRPAIKFSFSDYLTSGQQTFIDKKMVNPGDTVTAFIKILSVDIFKHTLIEGMEFEFMEGPRVTGIGKIIQIINPELKQISN